MACNTVVVQGQGKATVRIGGITPVPIVIANDVVARINANRPQTRVLAATTPVQALVRPTNVEVGGLGVQGRPGQPGSTIPAINFAWGDAAHIVWTPSVPGLLTLVRIDIQTPFNGIAPEIIVGVTGDLDAAMPADQNDPTSVAKYNRNADLRLVAGQGVFLTITPGFGASTGDGLLILEFLPD